MKNYGGGNHLIVPTGLLQHIFAWPDAAALAPSFLVDSFGGGLVRIDSTSSATFRKLAVHGADMSDKLPVRASQILRQFNASGRYFEFYAARNYFDRPTDHAKTALHDSSVGASVTDRARQARSSANDPPYVVPAYELRRVLSLARARGEAFRLAYTRLPPALTTPTEWRLYQGPRVSLSEPGGGAPPTCAVGPAGGSTPFTGAACAADELAVLPPPPWLLTKWLHPYPSPLIDGEGDGVHCTT